jgi:hypothetical protein
MKSGSFGCLIGPLHAALQTAGKLMLGFSPASPVVEGAKSTKHFVGIARKQDLAC